MADKDLIDLKEIVPQEIKEVDLYQNREKIYTRKIEGFFQRIRLYTGWPLLLGYFLMPWLNWDGRQAILFDLPERKFYILGLVFWPQDFPLLAWLLIIAAFTLFAVTVFAGRIWCGYTCPQTVWTSIYMWWEQKVEGSRNQRRKLDKQPLSLSKAIKKITKHGGWLTIGLITGITFVGYFSPVRDLIWELFTASSGKWQYLWTLFFTLATYINAGWMREQVCKYVCPYARFQSVMFDHDTLIVSYDPSRGETRGSRKKSADHKALGLGDCIDCSLCVQVCPTGIDIRNGLQYECIGCALCIDACNSVMDKMNYPRGLIRYTSEKELEGGKTQWLRPRIIGYAIAIVVMTTAFGVYLSMRTPLELNIIRDRNHLFVTNNAGEVENLYTVQIVNMDQHDHLFKIAVTGLKTHRIIGDTEYVLNAGEVRDVNLRIATHPNTLNSPSTSIEFSVTAQDESSIMATSESRFMKPFNP